MKQKTAFNHQLIALLLEFNIRVSNRNGGLKGTLELLWEDAENDFTCEFRQALDIAWKQY